MDQIHKQAGRRKAAGRCTRGRKNDISDRPRTEQSLTLSSPYPFPRLPTSNLAHYTPVCFQALAAQRADRTVNTYGGRIAHPARGRIRVSPPRLQHTRAWRVKVYRVHEREEHSDPRVEKEKPLSVGGPTDAAGGRPTREREVPQNPQVYTIWLPS